MAQPRILIVEDERGLVQSLSWYFSREGYETLVAHDGTEGLRKAQMLLPDLVLLDVMLPGMDGLTICRELRSGERTRDIPIIMITAKAEEVDQIEGFAKGADDYVTKPFNNKILLQRVKALLRRVEGAGDPGDVVEHMGVKIDRIRHRITFNGKKLDLTPTEFRLLETMVRQPGRAFSRHQLMDAAIGEGQIVLERTIDVHVKTLRRKLGENIEGYGDDEEAELIETVRGVGYRFKEAVKAEMVS
jgi:two-component system phosphate regulon response regulator PhoB